MIYAYEPEDVQGIIDKRTNLNVERGSIDLRIDGAKRNDPDLIGVPAELIIRRWATEQGYDYEWPSLTDGPDRGWDFRNPVTGRTADVKATGWMTGHLLVPAHQDPLKVDRLILAITRPQVVILRGWVHSDFFVEHARTTCTICGLTPESGRWLHPSLVTSMRSW